MSFRQGLRLQSVDDQTVGCAVHIQVQAKAEIVIVIDRNDLGGNKSAVAVGSLTRLCGNRDVGRSF